MKHLFCCILFVFLCIANAEEITKGEKYVIKRDDTVAFTTLTMALRYARALNEGERPVVILNSMALVGGGGTERKVEYKPDVLRAAGKKAKRLNKGRKVEAVSVKDGVVCVQINKKTRLYVQWHALMPLADYEMIEQSDRPIGVGKAVLRNSAFLFSTAYDAREYVRLASVDTDTAEEWANAKRKSQDAFLFDIGFKCIVVAVDGDVAQITLERGEVFWCRCADVAMQ